MRSWRWVRPHLLCTYWAVYPSVASWNQRVQQAFCTLCAVAPVATLAEPLWDVTSCWIGQSLVCGSGDQWVAAVPFSAAFLAWLLLTADLPVPSSFFES